MDKNMARTRWRTTHVALWAATREAAATREDAVAFEVCDSHLGALQDWQVAEAAYIAARLGFKHDRLPPRRF